MLNIKFFCLLKHFLKIELYLPLININQINRMKSLYKLINKGKFTNNILYFNRYYHTMVEKENQIKKILKEREYPETKKMLETMNKEEKIVVPKLNKKITSYGNRIRIVNLCNKDAELYIGKKITVAGWVKAIKIQGKGEYSFVDLNDGSGFGSLQVVVTKNIPNFEILSRQGVGACLKIHGTVVKPEGGKELVEMQVNSVEEGHYCEVLGESNPSEYPLHKSRPNLETLREMCHLRPRTNTISAVTRVRNSLAYATHQFFQQKGFLYIHTPIITSSDCEGAGQMFQVTTVLPPKDKELSKDVLKNNKINYDEEFFKKPSFLTVSGQLAVENFACGLSDVYTFGPTFRAEISHTTRHLAEFWMIEPEMCFADLYDDMECGESYLKYCLNWVLENNKDDLEFLNTQVEKGLIDRLRNVVETDFEKISYTECIEILKSAVEKDPKLFINEEEEKEKKKKEKEAKKEKKKLDKEKKEKGDNDDTKQEVEDVKKDEVKKSEKELMEEDKRCIYWGKDMASEHERYLTEVVFKKPIIVYNYPKEIKSFYMRENEDGKTVAAMDILVPKIGEIIGGSQREERHDVLLKKIADVGLDKDSYWWYLDLRKYGSVPHCGFGLGFERLVMMATGIENIKDVIPYPRYHKHAEF